MLNQGIVCYWRDSLLLCEDCWIIIGGSIGNHLILGCSKIDQERLD
jgi:hypothetical protein